MNNNLPRQRRILRSRAAIFGTSSLPRIAVQKTAKHFRAQLINDEVGTSLTSASDDLTSKIKGVKQAEEVGTLLAQKAIKLGINRAVLDRRGYRYHGRIKAFTEAARAAGLTI